MSPVKRGGAVSLENFLVFSLNFYILGKFAAEKYILFVILGIAHL